MIVDVIFYTVIFLFGIVIGSFLNVCIYRIPKKENIVTVRSHCMSCNYQLKWYDMIPLFSYLFLRGRCRRCKAKLSVQYPLVEALNGILYVLTVMVNGANMDSLLLCLLISALLVLSVIDFRTYEIPVGINIFIFVLGALRVLSDIRNWPMYLIGLFAVSIVLTVLYYATGGRAIGGGDIKLMAACGLFLGWKLIIFAFLAGCVLGAVIHVIRMKVSGENHVLAMGPYLSMGVFIAALWGNQLIQWYLGQLPPV